MSVDEMVAGEQLDAAVAESVMGLAIVKGTHADGRQRYYRYEPHCDSCQNYFDVPNYSTDREAALTVVDRLAELGWEVAMDTPGKDQKWEVTVMRTESTREVWPYYIRQADTLPLAVCRAALKAIEQQP